MRKFCFITFLLIFLQIGCGQNVCEIKNIVDKKNSLFIPKNNSENRQKLIENNVKQKGKCGNTVITRKKSLQDIVWMKYINDDLQLNQINIPGSHDTLAYEMSNSVKQYAQCQTLSLKEQMRAGIRIFDIRLFFNEKTQKLCCCHGKGIFQCNCHKKNSNDLVTYDYLIENMLEFLERNPSEVIIIAPKYESGHKKLTIDAINKKHKELKRLNKVYTEKKKIPKIGDVRGKIVLWDKKGDLEEGINILTNGKDITENVTYANVHWRVIQKRFNTNPKEKMQLLSNIFGKAEKEQGTNFGFINYTSGFAKTKLFLPDAHKVANEVNPFLKRHNFKNGTLYGWFLSDFVDEELAKKIFEINNFNEKNIVI